MRRVFFVLSLGMFLAACGNGDDDTAQPATGTNGTEQETVLARSCDDVVPNITVEITSAGFSASETDIPVNGVVRWLNSDVQAHSVVSGEPDHADAGALFSSGDIPPGEDFCVEFPNRREVHYFCGLHLDEQAEVHIGQPAGDDDNDNGDTTAGSVEAVSCPDVTPNAILRIADTFRPRETSIPLGGFVQFRNDDQQAHTVTSGEPDHSNAGALIDSGLIEPGDSVCYRFNDSREVDIFCREHPDEQAEINVGSFDDDDGRDRDRDRDDRDDDNDADDDRGGPGRR